MDKIPWIIAKDMIIISELLKGTQLLKILKSKKLLENVNY